MKSKLILAAGLMSTLMLTGCLLPRTAKVRTLMPTKPTLEFVTPCPPPATLCLDDANAAKLGVYIMELERVKK